MGKTVRDRYLLLSTGMLLASASGANALCVYHGELYAKTSLSQEFRDSAFVVEGTVLSSREIPISDNDPDTDAEPGVVYRVRIDRTFKGHPTNEIHDYSERHSGGFYLDAGKRYLLFLNPMDAGDWARKVAAGAMRVNYSCGQSQPWENVSGGYRAKLKKLSAEKE